MTAGPGYRRPVRPAEEDVVSELHARYLDALLRPDPAAARRLVVEAADDGVPIERLYLDVLAPAMHAIGESWERAEIGVAQEHLATQVTQTVIASLALRLRGTGAPGGGGPIVLACTPGEMHVLGLAMISDFLEADGREVMSLGADTPLHALVAFVERHAPAAVALSTTLPRHLLQAGRTFAALARIEPRPLLIAGGNAYEDDEARALAAGADALARSPAELLALLDARAGR